MNHKGMHYVPVTWKIILSRTEHFCVFDWAFYAVPLAYQLILHWYYSILIIVTSPLYF